MSGQEEQAARHSRHLRLSGIGIEGLRRWQQARIQIEGEGVAARLAALYLSAAGIGGLDGEGLRACDERDGRGPGLRHAVALRGEDLAAVAAAEQPLDLTERGEDPLQEAWRGALAATALLLELATGERPPDASSLPAPPPLFGDPLVAVLGAGGLGCPAALALALVGVRRIVLIDDDRVELSNLPRQVLHTSASIGQLKVDSAAATLQAHVPGIVVRRVADRLTAANAERLLDGVDLVIEGSDNFPTKYRANAAAIELGIPAVIGGVIRFDGQVVAVDRGCEGPGQLGGGACYRCLFQHSPATGELPTCSSVGVLAPVAGLVAIRQVHSGLQLLAARRGAATSPAGELWTWDARRAQEMILRGEARADCVACGAEADEPLMR